VLIKFTDANKGTLALENFYFSLFKELFSMKALL